MELYLTLKWIHILSSTLLFGTGLGSAFYLWRAHRTGEAQIMASVVKNVVLADWLFTTPSVIIQPVTGIWMLSIIDLPLTTPWVFWSLWLYGFVGCCWLPVVWIQIKVSQLLAKNDGDLAQSLTEVNAYMRWWYGLGWPAFLSVVAVFYLMVLKPVSLF